MDTRNQRTYDEVDLRAMKAEQSSNIASTF